MNDQTALSESVCDAISCTSQNGPTASSFPLSACTVYILPKPPRSVRTSRCSAGTFHDAQGVCPYSIPALNYRTIVNTKWFTPCCRNSGGVLIWRLTTAVMTCSPCSRQRCQTSTAQLVEAGRHTRWSYCLHCFNLPVIGFSIWWLKLWKYVTEYFGYLSHPVKISKKPAPWCGKKLNCPTPAEAKYCIPGRLCQRLSNFWIQDPMLRAASCVTVTAQGETPHQHGEN